MISRQKIIVDGFEVEHEHMLVQSYWQWSVCLVEDRNFLQEGMSLSGDLQGDLNASIAHLDEAYAEHLEYLLKKV